MYLVIDTDVKVTHITLIHPRRWKNITNLVLFTILSLTNKPNECQCKNRKVDA